MKIISWNINSLRLRLPLLEHLINCQQPDVICLQETKVPDELFPQEALHNLGYPHLAFRGEKSYNGVAIISKLPFAKIFHHDFVQKGDMRHIAVQIRHPLQTQDEILRYAQNDITLHNFYIPAGGDIPDIAENPKFAHKLNFVDEMGDYFAKNDDNSIILGDFNIAPHEHDVWSSKQLKNIVSHTNIEREKLINTQNKGNFCDIARKFIPMQEKSYSWWSYRSPNWENSNKGRRLDHIWIRNHLSDKVISYQVFKEFRGMTQPSDHVPIMVELR
jgi:exodeoxyribonuclease-3